MSKWEEEKVGPVTHKLAWRFIECDLANNNISLAKSHNETVEHSVGDITNISVEDVHSEQRSELVENVHKSSRAETTDAISPSEKAHYFLPQNLCKLFPYHHARVMSEGSNNSRESAPMEESVLRSYCKSDFLTEEGLRQIIEHIGLTQHNYDIILGLLF